MSAFLLRKFKIKNANRQNIEPQEVFLDQMAKRKEEEFGFSEKKMEIPVSKKITIGYFGLMIILMIVLLVKTFDFAVAKSDDYRAMAEDNKFISSAILADRGVIYDRNGQQLVFNRPSFSLVLDKDLATSDSLIETSAIIDKDLDSLPKTEERVVTVLENINHETLIILQTKIDRLAGFSIIKTTTRHYEGGPELAHIIGYINRQDGFGRDGLEKVYEEDLRRNPGEIQVARDVYGNVLSKELISYPEVGNSLVLHTDAGLQKKIYEVLQSTLDRIGSNKGVAVAMDPKNGGVLGLVSIPSYDNNLFGQGADQKELADLLNDSNNPLFNRAVSGLYPTGSTIKPLVALKALKEEIISPDKIIQCNGQIEIPHRYDQNITYYYRDWAVHGPSDMRKALAESCNVYFYTIGGGYGDQIGLGPTRIKEGLESFGWGAKTGIDLPGERDGSIPSPEVKKELKGEDWWDGDTYNFSIGQGDLLITPLQVVASFVPIANGGIMFSPQVVKTIIDANGSVVKEFEPKVIKSGFIDRADLKVVREGMRQAVTGIGAPHASSVILNSLPVPAAAKTGTAETPYNEKYHNWATVFAPYDDPEIVITIMMENVPGIQSATLPAARDILNYYFSK